MTANANSSHDQTTDSSIGKLGAQSQLVGNGCTREQTAATLEADSATSNLSRRLRGSLDGTGI